MNAVLRMFVIAFLFVGTACGDDVDKQSEDCQRQLDAFETAKASAAPCDPRAVVPCEIVRDGTAKDYDCNDIGASFESATLMDAARSAYSNHECPAGNRPPCAPEIGASVACVANDAGGYSCVLQQ